MAISCDPSTLGNAARCFNDCTRGPIGQSIKTYLLCQYANVPTGPAIPGSIDISNASVAGNTIVTWTNSDVPTTNEIWKSVNGGAFALYSSVAGTTHTFTDVAAMAVNTHWEYQVRACSSTCSAFTSSVGVSRDFAPLTLTLPTLILAYGNLTLAGSPDVTLTMPLLRRVFGSFLAQNTLFTAANISSLAAVGTDFNFNTSAITSLTANSLLTVGGAFSFSGANFINSISVTSLTSIGGIMDLISASLSSISAGSLNSIGTDWLFNGAPFIVLSFPSLATVGGDISGTSCPALTTFSIPAFTTLGGNMDLDSSPALANVSMPSFVITDGATLDFSGCGIAVGNSAAGTGIDGILRRGVASGTTVSIYALAGGTNTAPDAAGLVDKGILIGAGNTVLTN